MDWTAIAAIAGVAGGVLTKLADLALSRWQDRRVEHIDERRLLSDEARELRRQMLEDLDRYRAEIAGMRAELDRCNSKHSEAIRRIEELEGELQLLRSHGGRDDNDVQAQAQG